METKMLEAISMMLEGSSEPKVECAKVMLDKIIEGRTFKDEVIVTHKDMQEYLKTKTMIADEGIPLGHCVKAVVESEPQYLIAIDAGMLEIISVKYGEDGEIEEAPTTLKLMVDGKATTYGEAKGKKCEEGNII